KNKFFPKPGELRARVMDEQRELRARAQYAALPKPGSDVHRRPIMWHAQPRAMWKPHWRDDEIPLDWREARRMKDRQTNAHALLVDLVNLHGRPVPVGAWRKALEDRGIIPDDDP